MAEEIEAPITVNIGNLCKGAIIDAFENELQKCLNNINDINTSATAKRKIKLSVTLSPDESRTKIYSEFNCDSSLAQPRPVMDVFYVGKDPESGTLYGLTSDPRQQQIVFTPPKPKEAPAPIQFKQGK